MSVVSFTPVRQSDEILELHLVGLDSQGIDSWFYDDNDRPSSLLADRTTIPTIEGLPSASGYQRDETGVHLWSGNTVARVSQIKNRALSAFLKSGYEWVFLIDSDVIIPPGFIDHLLGSRLPVVAGVYWTDWGEGAHPNVWDVHPYQFSEAPERFCKPNHYQVGGLGACTLIHRTVIESGVNFHPVMGLPWPLEDRHFCVRAASADIPLVACTHHDIFHVYYDSQIEEARQWLRNR